MMWNTALIEHSFTYSGANIAQVTMIETYYPPTGPKSTRCIMIYHGCCRKHRETIITRDRDNDLYDSIHYYYNTHPNYSQIVNPHFGLFDPNFQLHVGMIPHLPYFYSKNNVTRFVYYLTYDYDISYGLDSFNNVTGIDMGGSEYMKYRYSCD